MNSLNTFLARVFTPQALFIPPLLLTYMAAVVLQGGGFFVLLLTLATGGIGWYCDKKTLETVPQIVADDNSGDVVLGASVAMNLLITLIVMVDTHRPQPSGMIFLAALGMKAILPLVFTLFAYRAFHATGRSVGDGQSDVTGETALANTRRQWQEQDRLEGEERERARLKSVRAAQALVLDFYTKHRAELKAVLTDSIVLTKVQAAIKTTASLEEANAAANILLTELHQHLKAAAERERQRKQKLAEIDSQIGKLQERIDATRSNSVFDDEESREAEVLGLERQLVRLTEEKKRLLNSL